jgi:molybdate/tungstate transport system substrate-binding protein
LFRDEDIATITVPEIVNTVPNSGLIVRGASVELLALLESGDLDYAFEYESVILQHGLNLLALPPEINLGVEGVDYSGVEVLLDFQRFATVKPIFRGYQIGYGITIPGNSVHPEEAALYIAFLLNPEGRAIMEANKQPLFDQIKCEDFEFMPQALQQECILE